MSIHRLRVRNFKSFADVDVQLSSLNALIGANASGKSNFVGVFRFLRDIARYGLENAVSLHGGAEYLPNLRIGPSEPVEIHVETQTEWTTLRNHSTGTYCIKGDRITYDLLVTINKRGQPVAGAERYTMDCRIWELPLDEPRQPQQIGQLELVLEREKQEAGDIVRAAVHAEPTLSLTVPQLFGIEPAGGIMRFAPGFDIDFPISYETAGIGVALPPNVTMIESDVFRGIWKKHILSFCHAGIYDFVPEVIKHTGFPKAMVELAEDGSNLALVVQRLLKDEKKRTELHNLLSAVLDGVGGIDVKQQPDRSLLVALQEKHAGDRQIPLPYLSEGTVELLAVIVALYFSENRIVVIEEPDRNVHPRVISLLVQMLKEVSERRQVLFTTHNPETVRHLPAESLLLVSRDKEGFSTITRPLDSQQVRYFLQDEFGMDELFVHGQIGV